jgi:hypothetical protein
MRASDGLMELRGRRLASVQNEHDYLQVRFGADALLNIFNRVLLDGESGLQNLVGSVVTGVDCTQEQIRIHFGSACLSISLEEASWTGPEALALYLGDQPPIIVT